MRVKHGKCKYQRHIRKLNRFHLTCLRELKFCAYFGHSDFVLFFRLSVCLVLGRRAVMRVRGMADSSGCDPSVTLPDSFQQLSRLMQFPEEVAIQLTDVEHRLFSRVSAVDYVRLVSSDLTKQPLTLPTSTASHSAKPPPTVSDLILRFQQVYVVRYNYRSSDQPSVAVLSLLFCWPKDLERPAGRL